jgi:hypothetical protein
MVFKRGRFRIHKRFIVYGLVIALLLLLGYLLIDLGYVSNPFVSNKNIPATFEIRDECSLIAGQVIHVINNDGNCRIMCRAACEVRTLEFASSVFTQHEKGCHSCECSCS